MAYYDVIKFGGIKTTVESHETVLWPSSNLSVFGGMFGMIYNGKQLIFINVRMQWVTPNLQLKQLIWNFKCRPATQSSYTSTLQLNLRRRSNAHPEQPANPFAGFKTQRKITAKFKYSSPVQCLLKQSGRRFTNASFVSSVWSLCTC